MEPQGAKRGSKVNDCECQLVCMYRLGAHPNSMFDIFDMCDMFDMCEICDVLVKHWWMFVLLSVKDMWQDSENSKASVCIALK